MSALNRPDEKGLRQKYSIMTNLWLLAQMRQPGRSIHVDLEVTSSICSPTRTILISTRRWTDVHSFSPSWTFCLSYEFELRKEAIRPCKEQSYGIQAALWAALRNNEHRMKHWLQLAAIPNAPSSSNAPELQALKKRITGLEKARSRSRRRQNRRLLLVVLLCLRFPLLRHPLRAGKEEEEATTRKVKKEEESQHRLLRSLQFVPRTSTT